MSNNATDYREDENSYQHIQVNSIQNQIWVERMPIQIYTTQDLYSYDVDNLYPQKALSICDRSWSLDTATKTLSDFIRGDGFEDEKINDLEINDKKLTGFYLLKLLADIKSKLGFAIHVNYNLEFRISEINYIDFENIRVKTNGQLIWRKDWRKTTTDTDVIYDAFNPDPLVVREQINKAGGIENWNGQVLFWTGTNDIYPLAKFDAVLDDGQYQAEQKLDSLNNVQNGFSLSGAFFYPKIITGTEEQKEIESKIKYQMTGGKNSGRILAMQVPQGIEKGSFGFESFERTNIDSLYVNQNEGAFKAIFSNFRQPLILNSITEGGMFNQEQYNQALTYYNSVTELERKEVEKTLNMVFQNSIWSDQITDVKIKPKPILKVEENIEVDKAEVIEGGENGSE